MNEKRWHLKITYVRNYLLTNNIYYRIAELMKLHHHSFGVLKQNKKQYTLETSEHMINLLIMDENFVAK